MVEDHPGRFNSGELPAFGDQALSYDRKHCCGQELSVTDFRMDQGHMGKPLMVSATVIWKRIKERTTMMRNKI